MRRFDLVLRPVLLLLKQPFLLQFGPLHFDSKALQLKIFLRDLQKASHQSPLAATPKLNPFTHDAARSFSRRIGDAPLAPADSAGRWIDSKAGSSRLDDGRKAGAVTGLAFQFRRSGLLLHAGPELFIKMPCITSPGCKPCNESRVLSLMFAPEVKSGTPSVGWSRALRPDRCPGKCD